MPVTFIQSGRFSSTFDPTSIAGCKLWLDASDASTFTYSSGVVVSQWNDKSGNANHFTQGTAANQPSRSGTQNGLSSVVFDGSNDSMTGPDLNRAQPYTVFMVAKKNTSVTVASMLTNSLGTLVLFPWTTNWSFYAGSSVVGTIAHDQAIHTFSAVFNGASSNLYVDAASGGSGNIGSQSLRAPTIGTGGGGNAWPGDACELLVYDSALGTTDRQSVEAYLKAKWGTP